MLFALHFIFILVAKPVGWSINFKLRAILFAVADPWEAAGAYFLSLPSLKWYQAIIVKAYALFRKVIDAKIKDTCKYKRPFK